MTETTLDKLLNGRFEVEQPQKGYRIAVDTLLLAAAVPAQAGETVLELGCGVGGVMLALACRVQALRVTGVEVQPALAALAVSNAARNGWGDRLEVMLCDLAALPQALKGAFDHVVMNPPYHDPKSHGVSANDCKRVANTESESVDLSVWIRQAFEALREGGVLSMIHRADRVDEIVCHLAPLFGEVSVKMICPKEDGPPRRVVIRARKSGAFRRIEEAPLILYGPDGRYSEAAERLLRGAEAMG